jgi:hypothetical protein
MPQDRPICRFCLDSSNTKRNLLIDPCECRGSMKYVHEKCLLRWRRMDPGRNGVVCLLCLQPYTREIDAHLEVIPDSNTLLVFLLRFPFILSVGVNYFAFFQYLIIYPKPDAYDIIEYYQYFFQILYFVLFWFQWNVRNKERYWYLWRDRTTLLVVCIHIASFVLMDSFPFFAIVPLNASLRYYWKHHIDVLHTINAL